MSKDGLEYKRKDCFYRTHIRQKQYYRSSFNIWNYSYLTKRKLSTKIEISLYFIKYSLLLNESCYFLQNTIYLIMYVKFVGLKKTNLKNPLKSDTLQKTLQKCSKKSFKINNLTKTCNFITKIKCHKSLILNGHYNITKI
jgi:hypothetical protein